MPSNFADTAKKTTTASITTTSTQIAPANPNRKGFYVTNNSTFSLYVCFGSTAYTSSPTKVIEGNETWECLGPTVYRGEITAIRNALASGTACIYELE